MSYDQTMLRLGSTAIAAVLALFATPVLAQSADATGAAPVSIAPPAAPAVTPAVDPAPAPAATVPSTISPAPAATPAPAAAMATQSTPVMHVEDSTADAALIAPANAAPKPAMRHAAETETAPRSVEASPAPVMPAPAPAPKAITPAPLPTPAPQSAAPKAQPVAAAAPASQGMSDDALMIAGAGGLGIILLAGGGYALMRKRREDEEDAYVAYESEAQAPAPKPVIAAPAATAPAMAMRAPAEPLVEQPLPEGLDISRYGRHAQAAFRGPTADNPSLSLKHRLKRAAFFDQRERAAAEAGTMPEVPTATAPQTISRPAPTEQLVFRPQRVSKPGFRPAFQTSRAR